VSEIDIAYVKDKGKGNVRPIAGLEGLEGE
jgi:hypothetical protein